MNVSVTKDAREKCSDSLEGEGAAVELLGSAEAGLLGWRAAEQQELMRGVHELQLLPWSARVGRHRERTVTLHNKAAKQEARLLWFLTLLRGSLTIWERLLEMIL